jgi:hypothetical protein
MSRPAKPVCESLATAAQIAVNAVASTYSAYPTAALCGTGSAKAGWVAPCAVSTIAEAVEAYAAAVAETYGVPRSGVLFRATMNPDQPDALLDAILTINEGAGPDGAGHGSVPWIQVLNPGSHCAQAWMVGGCR